MPWDRAPLNLTSGTRVYIEPPRRPEEDRPIELFISPFSPERWSDLWQLELVLSDRCGLLGQLCSFLRDHGVMPLVAETSSFDCGDQHKVVVFCDCRRYTGGTLDLDSERRGQRERMDLHELRAAIATEFVEALVFANGIEPNISLTRNTSHHRAFRRLKSRRRSIESATVDRGKLRLPNTLVSWIEDIIRKRFADTRYMIVSDSGERALRGFVTTDESRVVHLRGSLQGPTDAMLAVTLQQLHSKKFDVLGTRLRFGLLDDAAGEQRQGWRTLDVFLRVPRELASLNTEELGLQIDRLAASVSHTTNHKLLLRICPDDETRRTSERRRHPPKRVQIQDPAADRARGVGQA
jgi:hypothetical protein